ncbi:hypothetical protein CCH79_00016245 [Gambusia affinis]|uniref:Uncharacterized protein n=1 Tax=Gambusia affinis TaxID=33528 RepID=A0A315VL06_GAMAF|nr:hypothetical protein CCH79_00016245 [Gambusia affinis]
MNSFPESRCSSYHLVRNDLRSGPEQNRSISSNQAGFDLRPASKRVTLRKKTTDKRQWDTSSLFRSRERTAFRAGIPIIMEGNFDATTERSFHSSNGETLIKEEQHSVTIRVTMPPNHRCRIEMVGFMFKMDILYTARLSRSYEDGVSRSPAISGVYHGVQMGQIVSLLDDLDDLGSVLTAFIDSFLDTNVSKTKQMLIDFRKTTEFYHGSLEAGGEGNVHVVPITNHLYRAAVVWWNAGSCPGPEDWLRTEPAAAAAAAAERSRNQTPVRLHVDRKSINSGTATSLQSSVLLRRSHTGPLGNAFVFVLRGAGRCVRHRLTPLHHSADLANAHIIWVSPLWLVLLSLAVNGMFAVIFRPSILTAQEWLGGTVSTTDTV